MTKKYTTLRSVAQVEAGTCLPVLVSKTLLIVVERDQNMFVSVGEYFIAFNRAEGSMDLFASVGEKYSCSPRSFVR